MKKMTSIAAMFALGTLVACTDADDRTTAYETTSEEVVTQEAGIANKESNVDKGRADVQVQKRIVETKRETESIPTVERTIERADINRMDVQDFVALGLPERTAKTITDFRDKNGSFKSVDELRRVPGMDQAWLQKHQSHLGIS